ncbi:MAG: hypothetical protein K6U04_02315 [Armatimonadetes bacterium]|nr:hypothetical protein [Armatimonadota bacterium]
MVIDVSHRAPFGGAGPRLRLITTGFSANSSAAGRIPLLFPAFRVDKEIISSLPQQGCFTGQLSQIEGRSKVVQPDDIVRDKPIEGNG